MVHIKLNVIETSINKELVQKINKIIEQLESFGKNQIEINITGAIEPQLEE